jgi:trehalose synthase-fused probable maltokinase
MNGIELSKLPEYLRNQRWFGSKGKLIKHVEVVDHAELSIEGQPGRYLMAVVQVSFELGAPERYQMLVRPHPDGSFSSALEEEAFARELLNLIREGRSSKTAAGVVRGQTSGPKNRLERLSAVPKVRLITSEQSNTSVVFDERAILKVIRKIVPGVNPEAEMAQFLSAHGPLEALPAFLGSLELDGQIKATLGVLHEFLPAESDGWKYTLEVFRSSPVLNKDFLREVAKLGATLAELHVALASDPNDLAFAPEDIQREDLQRWSSSIIGEIGVTLAAGEKQLPALAERREALVERARKLAQLSPSGKKIRLHGDLHLGQVLRVRNQWKIFDFEGEPARGYNQRREKHSPLKDVAAMLRSFAYAAAAVEIGGAPATDRAGPSRQAFLEGYLGGTKAANLLPAGEENFRVMLDALELERTIYELRYELQSRPDWVHIPVRTLMPTGRSS